MKNLKSKGAAIFTFGVMALCVSFLRASAEIVFQADFSGPGTSKTGSPYDCVSKGGVLAQLYSTPSSSTQIKSDDPMASEGGYLGFTTYTNAGGTTYAAKFTPNSPANSMDAMTSVSNGNRVINGGVDFFFRSNRDSTNSELRALDFDNRGKGGLRIIFAAKPTAGLALEVLSNDNGLFASGEGGSASKLLTVGSSFQMLANTVYHLGLTFATDTEGTVTAKLWGQAGTNAIDLTTATPAATLTFGINEAVVTNGFTTGDFYLGRIWYDGGSITPLMTQEFDQLRIYDSTPTYFGALQAQAEAWPDSKPEIVLQADFSGAGNGTGGTNDIVALGGTAVLADAGNYSFAKVTDAQPFKTFSKGYLSILTTNNPSTGAYGHTKITPASAANSLDAMTSVTNNQRVIRGGFDFFFRADKNIDYSKASEFRPIDSDNRSAGGLRFALYSNSPTKMAMEIIAPSGSLGLFLGGEGETAVTSFLYTFDGQLVSNTIYHVGVSFSSDDSGNVTAAAWLKEGTEAIDLRRELPIGAVTFGIDESVVTKGFATGVFNFGKLREVGGTPSKQEFETFRIYNDTPLVFPELPSAPPMGTIITIL